MQIATKHQAYKDGDTILNGVFFWDESQTAKRPGVLVVHGGAGLDDHAKNRARRFAELGYVAFACDMYGEGVAGSRERIMACINNLRAEPDRLPHRAGAGIDVLRSHPLDERQHRRRRLLLRRHDRPRIRPQRRGASPASSASMAASTRSTPPLPTPSERKSSFATARSIHTSRSLKSPVSPTK